MTESKKIFAICDLDEHYVVRLANYLTERKTVPFEILAFTNLDSLSIYAGSHPIEILLISRQALNEKVKELNIRRILLLSDSEEFERQLEASPDDFLHIPDEEDTAPSISYPSIRKYQSSENIAREVMSYYTEGRLGLSKKLQEIGTSIYAVHSPIARCGKTLFSLTLSEILGEKKKTLYLNLENYSGFEALFGQTYRSDLTDLVYLSRKNEGSLPMKLEHVIRPLRNADYIPLAFFPGDLREIHAGEWISFLTSTAALMEYQAIVLDIGSEPSEYQAIVLDIGSEPSDIPDLLSSAAHIYMPVLPDPLSRAKISQYEKDMEALSLSPLMDRTVRLYLPEVSVRGGGSELLDHLISSDMGRYVRRLLSEEAMQACTPPRHQAAI